MHIRVATSPSGFPTPNHVVVGREARRAQAEEGFKEDVVKSGKSCGHEEPPGNFCRLLQGLVLTGRRLAAEPTNPIAKLLLRAR